MENHQIRVVIVGGGVVGLVLSNALEQAGVDFVVLERRGEISPRIGQSIAAEPNGSRQACVWWYERDTNGEVLLKTDGVKLGGSARTGYDFQFGERTKYLDVFYANIKDKSKVLLGKNVTLVEQSESGVTVQCDDGTSYRGDILAGADGVRSKVRAEMWRLAGSSVPRLVEHDKNALFSEYRALFGISEAPPPLVPGDCDFGYDNGRSTLVFAGHRNKAYVFIFEKMDRMYRGADIPRFTKDDALSFVERHRGIKIRPNLTIADFWETMDSYSLTCLEEGVFKLWTWGRIACVGDSAHKMTPNIGAGGNAGIESAAALANAVKSVVDRSNGRCPSTESVAEALREYQKQREARAGAMVLSAGEVTRMQAGRSLYHRLAARMARLYPGDFIADYLSGYFSGAVALSYLPPPHASLRRHQPFNPTQGWSRNESRIKRALLALPFLAAFALARAALDVTTVVPMLAPMVRNKTVVWNAGSAPLRTSFYGMKRLDEIWTPINIFFTPAIYGFDSVCRTQSRTFLTDYGVVTAIWAFESVRRANALTFARLPVLFTFLGQLRGIGVVSSIYYFLYYVSLPIERFKASDMRLGRLNYTVVVLPTLVVTYYVPVYAMLDWPTLAGREAWLFLWQMFPVWISITAALLSSFVPDTTVSDRFESPNRDLPVIRYTIGTLAVASSAVWLSTCIGTLFRNGIASVFVPDVLPRDTTDFAAFTREFLKFDEIFLFGNTFLWLGYLFWDLKYAGMLTQTWIRLLAYLLVSVSLVGPGATAGLGWLWRENVLASKRHKDAVTESGSTEQEAAQKEK